MTNSNHESIQSQGYHCLGFGNFAPNPTKRRFHGVRKKKVRVQTPCVTLPEITVSKLVEKYPKKDQNFEKRGRNITQLEINHNSDEARGLPSLAACRIFSGSHDPSHENRGPTGWGEWSKRGYTVKVTKMEEMDLVGHPALKNNLLPYQSKESAQTKSMFDDSNVTVTTVYPDSQCGQDSSSVLMPSPSGMEISIKSSYSINHKLFAFQIQLLWMLLMNTEL